MANSNFLDKIKCNNYQILKESFRISMAVMLSFIVASVAPLTQSYWVVLTIFIIYATSTEGLAIRKSKDRILGTMIGILITYAMFILIPDVQQASYIIIGLFIVLGAYFAMIKGFYGPGLGFATVALFFSMRIATPDMDTNQILLARMLDVTIGGFIVLLCEIIIFPGASSVKHKLLELHQQMREEVIGYIKHALTLASRNQPLEQDSYIKIESLFNKHIQLKDYYYSQMYEIRYKKLYNYLYNRYFSYIDEMFCYLEHMNYLINHHYLSAPEKQAQLFLDAIQNKHSINNLEISDDIELFKQTLQKLSRLIQKSDEVINDVCIEVK